MIYIASKTKHAPRWRQLRAVGFPIISSWIDEAGPGESVSRTSLWMRNINESANAELTIVYNEDGEIPKGALVEMGSALGNGKIVYWVGPVEPSEVQGKITAVDHPNVKRFETLEEALELAVKFGE